MKAFKTLLALSLAGILATSASAASFTGTAIDGDTTSFSGTVGDTLSLAAMVDPVSNYYTIDSLTLTTASTAVLSAPFQAWFFNGTDEATSTAYSSSTANGLTTHVFEFGTAAWNTLDGGAAYALTFHDLTPAAGTVTFAVTAVPEPESYAMIMAGLGALGFMARRRKSA